MDIVLEFLDTIIADYAYAHLFPIEYPNNTAINASEQVMEPKLWREMSSLSRDNLYRQFCTAFFGLW